MAESLGGALTDCFLGNWAGQRRRASRQSPAATALGGRELPVRKDSRLTGRKDASKRCFRLYNKVSRQAGGKHS